MAKSVNKSMSTAAVVRLPATLELNERVEGAAGMEQTPPLDHMLAQIREDSSTPKSRAFFLLKDNMFDSF